MGEGPICQLNNVNKTFFVKQGFFSSKTTEIKALRNINLEIKKNEILGVVGESGCGKSTLAKVILGLEKVDSGQIFFEGVDIAQIDKDSIKSFRKRVQMVFQDPFSSLNPKKTIYYILSKPLKIHNICSRRELEHEVRRLLNICGLDQEGILNRYPHEFSGGQRQRIGIARALATKPDLIILDEPTSALDVSIQAQIINLILTLQKRERLSCLFISHDLPIVEFVSHRIVVMYKGCIMEIMPKGVSLHHPYTNYLLESVPLPNPNASIFQKRAKDFKVRIKVPDKLNPTACPFSQKCSKVTSRCLEGQPELRQIGKDHFIACFNI